ncbi:MAG: hypothetical protein VXW88_06040, partial [Pseudomonadota bacterium]|nr:hypothetical protein [Pseudomonadota bacterium]
ELEAALPQRKWVFAHNFFPKDYYLGVLRLFLRMCRQQGVSSSGVGSSGERRNPGAGLAAGREDVQRNF